MTPQIETRRYLMPLFLKIKSLLPPFTSRDLIFNELYREVNPELMFSVFGPVIMTLCTVECCDNLKHEIVSRLIIQVILSY